MKNKQEKKKTMKRLQGMDWLRMGRLAVLFGISSGLVSLAVAAGDFRIDSYGARTDGTKCTAAFAAALKAAVAADGGRIVVPKGEWLTGPVDIADVEVEKAERVVRVEATEDNPLKRIKFKNVRVRAVAKPDIVKNAEIER